MASDDPAGLKSRDFGRRVAAHRSALHLSQLQLALAAGVSSRHVSFLETGRASPSREMVARLATALSLTPAAHDALLLAAGLAPRELRGGADLIDRTIAIQEAATDDEALARTQRGLAALGLGHFFIGVLTPSPTGRAAVAFGDLRHAPARWIAHYRARGFRTDDPFVHATACGASPFFWSDVLRRRPERTPRERQILDEARAFGISGGFVMPTRLVDGRVFALSSMGDGVEACDPRVRWEARLIGAAALDRFDLPTTAPV